MTVLRADSAALQAYAAKKRREALPVVLVCAVAAAAIELIDYQWVMLALLALVPAIVVALFAVSAHRTAKRYAMVELDLASFALRTDRFTWPLAFDDLPRALLYPDALAVFVKRGQKLQRWSIPGDPASLEGAERALQDRQIPVRREGSVVAKMVAIVVGGVGFVVLSIGGGVMAIAGIANLILAAAGRHGSMLKGVGLLGGGLAILVVLAVVNLLVRSRAT